MSNTVSVLAAQVPSTPAAPTTSIFLTNVIVTWTAPYNGGSAITAYQVVIKQSNGTFSSTSVCNGTLSSVVTARTCTIPFTTLQASPYSLPWGSSIFANVTAINIMGRSITSASGNGAVILSTPSAPISLQQDFMNSNAYVLAFTWSDGLSDGGTPIIDYRVYYDAATDGANYTILDFGITAKNYQSSVPITAGKYYRLTVQSRNAMGYSPASDYVRIFAA